MRWRRRHCRANVAMLLLVLLCVGVLLMFGQHSWLVGKKGQLARGTVYPGQRAGTAAVTGANHSMARQHMWRDAGASPAPPRPGANLSSLLDNTSQQESKISTGSNASLSEEIIVESVLKVEPYSYIINEANKCQDRDPFLVLLIAVGSHNVEARDAIRQTWGNESVATGSAFIRLFLLGMGEGDYGLGSQVQHAIEAESRLHHDIIQQKYIDSYYNLTLKTLMGMNWVATYCPGTSYVMKTDSDMFVNTEYLIQKLLKPIVPPRWKYFTGYLMRGYAPNRNKDSKWYMPHELYPSKRYPTFCSGTGYVFSGDMAKLIYRASLSIRRLHLEDVYVGLCLAKLRIEPVPPPNEFLFNHWRVSYSSCKYSHLITSHQFLPTELVKYWHHLQSNKHNACTELPKKKV
ncbi:beta-1,3-galactosyltransferase 2 [Electrophorus electricus]|uniref:Hexosyltransferase n=1 Tax=Electrophorus electricus TaxID=8005 RepID=A0A4W4F624_ELEEL|nr:beta-1,3-galactosyltransferase 2 [Electrophorus electricus]